MRGVCEEGGDGAAAKVRAVLEHGGGGAALDEERAEVGHAKDLVEREGDVVCGGFWV